MMFKFVLLVLPTLISANINVNISGELHKNASNWELVIPKVSFGGEDVAIISDTERNTFNLSEDNLLNAVHSLAGVRPLMAYLHSSPGYMTGVDAWHEVTRILWPKSNNILNVSLIPTHIHEEVFINNMTTPTNFDVGISQRVQDTVSSHWSKEGELSVAQKIKYGINIFAHGRKISFNYDLAWGENTKQSQDVTVGATSPMQITLQPGQSVTSQLHVTKGNIQIQMEYAAKLSGQTLLDYAGTNVIGQFWLANISDCMNSSGISNLKISREVIDIGFYMDSKVIVYDTTNRTKLMEVAF